MGPNKGTSTEILRTKDMEVQLLKERASQLACPGRQRMVCVFNHLIYTNVFIAERRIGVSAYHSSEQNVKIMAGSL
jgi:hypothetical protein